MKVAVIDLGTNTFHLLIAETGISTPVILYKTQEPVKLGEDLTKANRIIPAAFERGMNCLKKFREKADTYGVEQIKALATSGVRSALNGDEFVVQAREHAGINIRVIDGDEEAHYIYEGVKWSGAISETALIMDIGGGSTEFILCTSEELIWKKSYDIGAARLMQRFFASDPFSLQDQQAIHRHLDTQLGDLLAICTRHRPQLLIGSAGAFETFYEMTAAGAIPAAMATINYTAYTGLAEKLLTSTHQQRAAMKGLIPLRVDMIVMATVLTNYILNHLYIRKIRLSTYDLKMGVLKLLNDFA